MRGSYPCDEGRWQGAVETEATITPLTAIEFGSEKGFTIDKTCCCYNIITIFP